MLGQSGSPEPARLVLPLNGDMGISVRAAKTEKAVMVLHHEGRRGWASDWPYVRGLLRLMGEL